MKDPAAFFKGKMVEQARFQTSKFNDHENGKVNRAKRSVIYLSLLWPDVELKEIARLMELRLRKTQFPQYTMAERRTVPVNDANVLFPDSYRADNQRPTSR